MEEKNIKQINLVLSLGKIFTGFKLLIIKIWLCIPLLSIGITIFGIILIVLGLMEYDIDIMIGLIIINLFALLTFSAFFYIYINNKKNLEKTKLYIQDAIKTTACARRLDLTDIKYKPYQVEIYFEINGSKYSKVSPAGNFIKGYTTIYAKYCNEKFDILYSPKYDEVMFLKK